MRIALVTFLFFVCLSRLTAKSESFARRSLSTGHATGSCLQTLGERLDQKTFQESFVAWEATNVAGGLCGEVVTWRVSLRDRG